MKKRWMIPIFLLSLALVLCAFPVTARAATAPDNLILGDATGAGLVVVSSGTAVNPGTPGTGAYWYDEWTGTLYLNGLDLSDQYYVSSYSETYGIYADGDLTVVICDGTVNTVGATDGAIVYDYGILSDGTLTIKGDTAGTGVLNVYAARDQYTDAVWVKELLTISAATVHAEAGGDVYLSYTGDIVIEDSTVSGICHPDQDYSYDGIYTDYDVTVTSSTVTLTATESCLYSGNATITDSTLDFVTQGAAGKTLDDYNTSFSAPLAVSGMLMITDSDVTADNQLGTGTNGYAVVAYSLVIDGGTLDADSVGCGIFAESSAATDTLTFSGAAKVDVKAADMAIWGENDVHFGLTGDGYVAMSGSVLACGVNNTGSLTLASDNMITLPAGGSVGSSSDILCILKLDGTPALTARVDGPDNYAYAAAGPDNLVLGNDDGDGLVIVYNGVILNPGTPVTGAYWYDDATGTLYLNGLDLSDRYYADDYNTYGIYSDGDLEIALCDGTTNTVGATSGAIVYDYGIYNEGALTIRGGAAGTGVLNVYAARDAYTRGILTYDDTLTISSATVYAEAGGDAYASGSDVVIEDSVVGGICHPDQSNAYDGIYTYYGDVTITSSTVTLTAPEAGIYAANVTVEDSTLNLTTKGASGSTLDDYDTYCSAPIYAENGAVSITNSTVTADNQLGEGTNGAAIWASGIAIDGGALNAASVGYGLYATGTGATVSLTFSGASKVDVDAAETAVYGIPDVDFNLTGEGYVAMNGAIACMAGSETTIHLSTGNSVALPAGGVVGELSGAWYILNGAGAPAASARVEGPGNPKTGVSDIAQYAVIVLLSAAALAVARRRMRRGEETNI